MPKFLRQLNLFTLYKSDTTTFSPTKPAYETLKWIFIGLVAHNTQVSQTENTRQTLRQIAFFCAIRVIVALIEAEPCACASTICDGPNARRKSRLIQLNSRNSTSACIRIARSSTAAIRRYVAQLTTRERLPNEMRFARLYGPQHTIWRASRHEIIVG